MKKFNIKVNGNAYEVEIEEAADEAVKPAAAAKPAKPAAKPAVKAAAPIEVAEGDTPVKSPMPGKIVKVSAEVGQTVKKGEILMILEAMKMQNEIAAPASGKVKSVGVAAGQNVKVGEVLAVIG